MKQHITRIASNCFHHLRRLRQIRRSDNVGEHVTSHLISAFRLSWLDYCNSLLAGLPRTSIEPLQRVQYAAARLVLNLVLRDLKNLSCLWHQCWSSYTDYLSNTESNTSCVLWFIKSTLGMHHSTWFTLWSQLLHWVFDLVWGRPESQPQ